MIVVQGDGEWVSLMGWCSRVLKGVTAAVLPAWGVVLGGNRGIAECGSRIKAFQGK